MVAISGSLNKSSIATMSRQTKTFPTMAAAKEFAATLGALTFESYRTLYGSGLIELSWTTLRVKLSKGSQPGFTAGKCYHVFREAPFAYLVRDDNAKVVKINRLTRMGGKAMFEVA